MKNIKDYMGFLMGEDVKLEGYELKFMEAEKERFNDSTSIKDLNTFIESANIMLKDLDFKEMDMSEKMIFESLKAAHLIKPILEEGDTYFDIDKKIADNPVTRKAYNVITQNVFNIYKEAGQPDLDIA